ncbi:conserved hypothetical protein [Leishmania braziliensis MHOM/BR/75/M2904]|uniref:Uncharacterized protein n=2 Tax=Leishmania braziliensis TaxID=5660 RepID=E9AIB9_LEIBR|nr:conserved hypothetical protein [Leishmania braziliensis MHOM/BR/75/M2904]CAJ2471943.1 unnamed protein product [Leishmania braziliensis]CBZ14563.1 conserved hypothetical protein [Leishmania braziliensis MHOM/BR/75/M2904]SYZ65507.1 hypothetical_protein [Leishmania braziliensis MHOM/BR/75/M2904]
MQIPRQTLAPLNVNGAPLSYDTYSAALQSTGGGGRAEGSPRASKHLQVSRNGHHPYKHDTLQPSSSSSPSTAAVHARTVGEQQGDHSGKAHLSLSVGVSLHTDAVLASSDEHVGVNSRTPHVPAPHDNIASSALATCAAPSPHSTRRIEIADVNPQPSVMGATHVSEVAAHSPPSNKPNAPSRRSSIARLREQVKAQQKGKEAAQPANATALTLVCDSNAAATALQGAAVQRGESIEQQLLYSYRPALPSTCLTSSPSPTSAEVTTLNRRGVTAEALAMPATLSVGTAKVLPNGLRSPSAITDVGAAPLDYSELDNEATGLVNNVSPSLHHHEQQQQRSASLSKRRTADVARGQVGCASQANAPFQALQFLSLAPTNTIASPPLSSRSGEPHHLHSPHQRHNLRAGGEEGGNASFLPDSGKDREFYDAAPLRTRSAHTAKAVADSNPIISSSVVSDCNLPSLVVCPFASMACCAEGTHRSVELHKGSTLHQHLMAVTNYLQWMRGRQQELEQLVCGLQLQVHTQALTLRKAREELVRVQQRPAANPSVLISSQRSMLNSCLDFVSTAASGSKAQYPHDACKALPRDVSIREPLVMDYEDGDGVGRDAREDYAGSDSRARCARPSHGTQTQRGGSDRNGIRLYARQLRMRASAGQQQPDMANAQSSTSISPIPVRCEQRLVASAGTATANQTKTAAGVQRRGGKMQPAILGQPKQREERQGITNCDAHALSGTPQRCRLHRNSLEDVSGVSGDGQVQGNADGAKGERFRTTSSVPRLSGADTATERGGSLVRHGKSLASSYMHYYSYPRQQPGAAGSAEVSGMSNVPPYQPPNESMSPISSASLDLNDHEDDTDAGHMRQQLFDLTATEISVPPRADEIYFTCRVDQPGADAEGKADLQTSPAASPRSAPSLVSVTYRPSELARTDGGNASEAVSFTGRVASTRGGASPLDARNPQVHAGNTSVPLLAGGVRLAASLQRPTLVRKSDIAPLTPAVRNCVDEHKVVLPTVTPPSLTALAGVSAPSATSNIPSKSDVGQKRHITVPTLSGINLDAPPSHLGVRTSLVVAAPSGSLSVNHSGVHASYDGISMAAPLLKPVVKRSSASMHNPVHMYGYRNDNNTIEGRRSGFVRSADYLPDVPGKSGRHRSRSKTRRSTAMRLPSHATSILSPQETADQGVVVPRLGLSPWRDLEV